MFSSFLRRFFRVLNKVFMVPMFRLGFGPFFGNPLSGYIMVLRIKGRRTGKIRYAPVNYALAKGRVYCIAGWGRTSDWFLNLLDNPDIEAILPGGAIAGLAEVAEDPAERAAAIRQVLKNGGFAGFLGGFNPYRVTDAELGRKTEGMPLVRIRPLGIGSGASDPAGWAWVWTLAFVAVLVLLLWFR